MADFILKLMGSTALDNMPFYGPPGLCSMADEGGDGGGGDGAAAGGAESAGGEGGQGAGDASNAADNGASGADTALGSGGAESPPPAPAWADNWRQMMAEHITGQKSGEAFDKEMKVLERMANPGDVYKSKREQDKKISSGELKAAPAEFPNDGTDEEKAAWRESNGIPTGPEGYVDHLDGIVISDADKPLADGYMIAMHEANMPPEAVRAGLDWYYKTQELQQQERDAADVEHHDASVESLREQMGGEFKRNMTDLNAWLANGPEGMADNLFGARLADGTLLGDNPVVLNWLVSQMREINPLSTVVPNAGGEAMQSVESEIAEIQRLIATEPQKYWGDKAKQERFQQLIAARDSHKAKAAAG